MLELTILDLADTHRQPQQVIEYLERRASGVFNVARTLVAKGWAVWPTITGLAIEPPGADRLSQTEIEEEVNAACVQNLVGGPPRRTLSDILLTENELHDRLWYDRKVAFLADPTPERGVSPPVIFKMLDAMSRVERSGDIKAPIATDYELGILHGKLSAIRWVLGDEWDNLDT
jgi:hypothetical protein